MLVGSLYSATAAVIISVAERFAIFRSKTAIRITPTSFKNTANGMLQETEGHRRRSLDIIPAQVPHS